MFFFFKLFVVFFWWTTSFRKSFNFVFLFFIFLVFNSAEAALYVVVLWSCLCMCMCFCFCFFDLLLCFSHREKIVLVIEGLWISGDGIYWKVHDFVLFLFYSFRSVRFMVLWASSNFADSWGRFIYGVALFMHMIWVFWFLSGGARGVLLWGFAKCFFFFFWCEDNLKRESYIGLNM